MQTAGRHSFLVCRRMGHKGNTAFEFWNTQLKYTALVNITACHFSVHSHTYNNNRWVVGFCGLCAKWR